MRFLALLTLLAAAAPASATAQAPDRLVVDGREHPLATNPLEPHLRQLGDRAPRFEPSSTALWRGYIATWEIASNRLWLRRVEVERLREEKSADGRAERVVEDVLGELFPGGQPVAASWYTGALIVPDGPLVTYVHMGYGSTYARYQVFIVRKGEVVERQRLSHDEFERYKAAKFERFKRTAQYRAALADTRARLSPRDAEDFLRDFYSEQYLSADGADEAASD